VAEYARAREDNAHHHFDRLQEIEARLEQEDIDPHAARVLLDSMKWRLAKQLPRSYGDRTRMDMTADVEVTTRVADNMPEWMKELIEERSRSLSTKPETITPPESLDDTEGDGRTDPVCA
jgi:hypothetical protein